jgi:8-amino-7-oxononanoate synthase
MSERVRQNEFWNLEIDDLRQRGLYRDMPAINGLPGRTTKVNGRQVLNFSSNNYLGLAGHPAVIEAGIDYTRRYGAGSTGSRLIVGNGEAHRELESYISEWKGTDAALIFGSGYQANLGVISSLAGQGDLIISDALNHASIIDGCRLSKAHVVVYPHFDLNRMEDAIRCGGFRRKLVVTESIFSMDGDRAPLREIADLCKRSGALLMVDEAHATGVLGLKGRGLAAELGVQADIQMGTLGKAVGAAGAYVAGDRDLVDLLVNKARSLVYTTATPPGVVGSALAALKIIASEEGDRLRARLEANCARFHGLLTSRLGDSFGAGHIVPFRIGESRRTMEISQACLQAGIFVQGIRFPTVPEGTSRLRFTLMSLHTSQDLLKATRVLERSVNEKHSR